jgi:hypothetical protein
LSVSVLIQVFLESRERMKTSLPLFLKSDRGKERRS